MFQAETQNMQSAGSESWRELGTFQAFQTNGSEMGNGEEER